MSLKGSLNTKSPTEDRSPEDLIREAEAEILRPRQSFDMVIPGEIRSRKDLSRDHQWLYALIRNLCRREGYCWATDEYLAQEMSVGYTKVSARTAQRYVAHLEKVGVIRRETINFQMKKRRRIFLTTEFKKVIIKTSVSPPYRQPCPQGIDTSGVYTEESLLPKRSSSSYTNAPREEEEPSSELEQELEKRFEESVAYAKAQGKRPPVKSPKWVATTTKDIERAARIAPKAAGSSPEKNLTVGQDLQNKCNTGQINAKIQIHGDELEISGPIDNFCAKHYFLFSDKNFLAKLTERLRIMGID